MRFVLASSLVTPKSALANAPKGLVKNQEFRSKITPYSPLEDLESDLRIWVSKPQHSSNELDNAFKKFESSLFAEKSKLRRMELIVGAGAVFKGYLFINGEQISAKMLNDFVPDAEGLCTGSFSLCEEWLAKLIGAVDVIASRSLIPFLNRSEVNIRRHFLGQQQEKLFRLIEAFNYLRTTKDVSHLEMGHFPAFKSRAEFKRDLHSRMQQLVQKLMSTPSPLDTLVAARLLSRNKYLRRMNAHDPAPFLNQEFREISAMCKTSSTQCALQYQAFLIMLDDFKQIELTLPTRYMWGAVVEGHFELGSEIRNETFAILRSTESFLLEQAKKYGDERLLEQEWRDFVDRPRGQKFATLYALFRDRAVSEVLVNEYGAALRFDPENDDLNESLRAALVHAESTAFALHCKKNPGDTGEYKGQFIKASAFDLEECRGHDPLQYSLDHAWHLTRDYWGLALVALAYVAAFAIGYGVSTLLITMAVRALLSAELIRGVFIGMVIGYGKGLAIFSFVAAEALIDMLLFTVAFKASLSLFGIEPFWNHEQGVLGNLVVPMLIGAGARLAIPALWTWISRWPKPGPSLQKLFAYLENSTFNGSAIFNSGRASGYILTRTSLRTLARSLSNVAKRQSQYFLKAFLNGPIANQTHKQILEALAARLALLAPRASAAADSAQ